MLPFPFELRTARILLRSPHRASVEALNAAVCASIDRLSVWMEWAQHVPSLAETRHQCDQAEAAFQAGDGFQIHIWDLHGENIIGATGVHRVRPEVPACEIGYWIRTGFEGRGYAREAVDALVSWLLAKTAFERLELRMDRHNVRSRALAERLGFELEGVLRAERRRVDASLRDTCVYARLRGESRNTPLPRQR